MVQKAQTYFSWKSTDPFPFGQQQDTELNILHFLCRRKGLLRGLPCTWEHCLKQFLEKGICGISEFKCTTSRTGTFLVDGKSWKVASTPKIWEHAWGDLPHNFSITSLVVMRIQCTWRPALSQTFPPAMPQSNQLYRSNPDISTSEENIKFITVICLLVQNGRKVRRKSLNGWTLKN